MNCKKITSFLVKTEAVFTVLVDEHLSARDETIFCNHSGILNQLMIDKFTADMKRTKTAICCLIVGLLQNWIDYWKSTRVKTNEMPFLNFRFYLEANSFNN